MLELKVLKLCHLISKDKYQEKREEKIVKGSKFFDAKWYLEKYPDVKKTRMNPAKHYCLSGWKAGYNPGPKFNTKDYLTYNSDVQKAGTNPLVHYEKFGKKEGRMIILPSNKGKTVICFI